MECVGAKYNSSNGKMRRITITKTTMFVIFNLQNSHFFFSSNSFSLLRRTLQREMLVYLQ